MYVTACNSYCHSSNKTDMKEPDKSTRMIKSVPKILNEDFREVAVIWWQYKRKNSGSEK